MSSKIYITSGLGPAAANEGFTEAYDLPNDTAYAETCASVALIFWAQRMLHLDLDGKYADVVEQALFNGALTGLSRDGEHYFYSNPLDSDGRHSRWAWHTCPCCTMNSSRLIASVGGYFISAGEGCGCVSSLRRHIDNPRSGRNNRGLAGNQHLPAVRLDQDRSQPANPARFTVKLRIPGWANGASAAINGDADRNKCCNGKRLFIDQSPMAARRQHRTRTSYAARAHLRASLRKGECWSRCAQAWSTRLLRRGSRQSRRPRTRAMLPRDAEIVAKKQDDLFGGTVILTVRAERLETMDWTDSLYRRSPPAKSDSKMVALPYYLWNNRASGSMQVWICEA